MTIIQTRNTIDVSSLQPTGRSANWVSRAGIAAIPGTAGELVQGQLPDGEDFLVTNPIDFFSRAQVLLQAGPTGVVIAPGNRAKARQAATAALAALAGDSVRAEIRIDSDLPIGKGMASSTADIVATIEAIARALKTSLTPEAVSAIAVAIEPSDGVMYRGIVAYNHRQGRLLEKLGPTPPMQQLVLDFGGSVDTVAFNQIPKHYSRTEQDQLAAALALVRDGVRQTDLVKIGQAATLSARVNQGRLSKPALEPVIAIGHQCGAYGVACAHSGTILSLIFDPADPDGPERARARLAAIFSAWPGLLLASSIASW